MNDKELDKELFKKMINPYCFSDENLKTGFKINLEIHKFNHANSILTTIHNFPKFGIEFRYIIKIIKELSVLYARLVNQYKLRYHTLFSIKWNSIKFLLQNYSRRPKEQRKWTTYKV